MSSVYIVFSSFYLLCIPQSYKVAVLKLYLWCRYSNSIKGVLLLFVQNVKVMLLLFDSIKCIGWSMEDVLNEEFCAQLHASVHTQHRVWAFLITCTKALK